MNNFLPSKSPLFTFLVTGAAGFIGSNFVPYFLEKYPHYRLVCLDKLTYAGTLDNLKEVNSILNPSSLSISDSSLQSDRYHFVKGDICNRELVEYLFSTCDIRGVIHFAAESHVDNSIEGPEVFIKTNVHGTFTLLDVARRYWMESPFKYKDRFLDKECRNSNIDPAFPSQQPRFHHVSTDEVYGTLGETGLFTEETPYAPNSPYSASKAASDMIVRSYHHTYGLNTVITNCSNNYGPKQHSEKLIPTIIRKALAGEQIPIYGDGKNIRDWLYVLDHCTGIDLAYHKGRPGETYNIGGRNERDNNYIAHKVCEILDELLPVGRNEKLRVKRGELNNHNSSLKGRGPSSFKSYKELIIFVKDRPGHDRRYAIDATKIEEKLGWVAAENFETGIRKTIQWYLDNLNRVNQQ